MNLLSLTLLTSLVASAAGPAAQKLGSRPHLRELRPSVDGWLSQEYGALPSTCDEPPSAPDVVARLARAVCAAAVRAPAPDLDRPSVRLLGGPAPGPGGSLTMTAEVKAPFDYEPPSWLVMHRVEASDHSRHIVEFWPADPRDLPGKAAHGAYVVVSNWLSDGSRTRGISFKLHFDGLVEPTAWIVDSTGGAHAPLQRPDVGRRLREELEFWATK